MIYKNALELIGHTPMVELTKIEKEYQLQSKIYAKLESFNPGGSIKDRIALKMIKDAESKGILKPGSVIIEPTSGNTGIGLALVSKVKGYRLIIVMPESMSLERRQLISAYGGEIVLTPKSEGMKGSINKANELVKEIPHSVILSQFTNPANPLAHYESTAVEIYDDLDGHIDVLIAGVGTGGTISGIGKYLKERNPNTKVIAVEPSTSSVLSGNPSGSHGIQGIGAGFIPETLDTSIYDEVIQVSTEEAYSASRLISSLEGLLVGISSGAALYAALEVAKREEYKNKNIVIIFPDTGEHYLSTDLYK